MAASGMTHGERLIYAADLLNAAASTAVGVDGASLFWSSAGKRRVESGEWRAESGDTLCTYSGFYPR